MMRRMRGLTLIELMIGIGVIAVTLSLAVPSMAAYLQRQRLKAAAQSLEFDLREARFEAARRGQAMHVVPRGGAEWCWTISTDPGCDCRVQHVCRIKTVRGSDLRGVHLLDAHALSFEPAAGGGGALQAAATLAIGSGEKVQVSVLPLGKPQVCMAEGSLPPFPGC